MSRIGRMPLAVPQGTKVELREGTFVAEGPRGRVEQALFAGFPVEIKESEITVSRPGDGGPERSRHGLLRALLANAVQGVSCCLVKPPATPCTVLARSARSRPWRERSGPPSPGR